MLVNIVSAQESTKSLSNNQLSSIANTCLVSPYACLENVDEILLSISPKSRIYFELLQYKFEALFNLQRLDELYNETKIWLNKPDLPLPFRITNAIYFAKSSFNKGDGSEARKSYQLAKSLLAEMNDAYPSPLRLVQFANLQMQLKEYQAAYTLLSGLAAKYKNSPDTRFMMELHGNLGHCANQMGNYQQALIHWQDTLIWSEKFGNQQQLAVVLFNLADVYFTLEKYQEAEEINSRSIEIATIAKDVVKKNHAMLHLAQTYIKLAKYCQAKRWFAMVNEDKLPINEQQSYQEIKAQVKICS